MNKFKVGDKVIALTNPQSEGGQFRVKGQTYTVEAIQYCHACGCQNINIGEKPVFNSLYIQCSCGSKQPHNNLGWTNSKYFAPIDNLENIMEEAIANEDYELCSLLLKNKII